MSLESVTNGFVLAHVLRPHPNVGTRLSGPLAQSAIAALAKHDARSPSEKREFVAKLVRELRNVCEAPPTANAALASMFFPTSGTQAVAANDAAMRLDNELEGAELPPASARTPR